MPLFRRLFVGTLVRLAVFPLALPCLVAICCCCCAALESRDARWQGSEVALQLGMGRPLAAHAAGVWAAAWNGAIAESQQGTNRCGCCLLAPDAKRPLVMCGSTQDRVKAWREGMASSPVGVPNGEHSRGLQCGGLWLAGFGMNCQSPHRCRKLPPALQAPSVILLNVRACRPRWLWCWP